MGYRSENWPVMIQGVYAIYFKNPKCVYIGCSSHVLARWCTHGRKLSWKKHHCGRLQAAYEAQGICSMNFVVLKDCVGMHLSEMEVIERDVMRALIARHGREYLLNSSIPVDREGASVAIV